MSTHEISALAWERMATSVEKVRDRLRRAVSALEQAKIPYVVTGSSAIAAWIADVDESAVRGTQEIDFILRHKDFERAQRAFEAAGFFFQSTGDDVRFVDVGASHVRHSVNVKLAGDPIRGALEYRIPDVDRYVAKSCGRTLELLALVEMQLASNRTTDRVDIRDMIDVGLIDQSWTARLPAELAARLQHLLDTPDG